MCYSTIFDVQYLRCNYHVPNQQMEAKSMARHCQKDVAIMLCVPTKLVSQHLLGQKLQQQYDLVNLLACFQAERLSSWPAQSAIAYTHFIRLSKEAVGPKLSLPCRTVVVHWPLKPSSAVICFCCQDYSFYLLGIMLLK